MLKKFSLGMTILLAGAALTSLAFTRFGYRLFLLDSHPTVEQFALQATREGNRARAEAILNAFFSGFNAMLHPAGPGRVNEVCRGLAGFLRPFCYEGAGVGFGPRRYFRWGLRLSDFGNTVSGIHPDYLLMYPVGLGFWAGKRYGGNPQGVMALASRAVRPGFEGLVFDGYGFKLGLIDAPADPSAINACQDLGGGAADACYQGVGRSFWFLFMDDPEEALRRCSALADPASEYCLTGLGLAATFTGIDDLANVVAWLDSAHPAAFPFLRRGFRIALVVRKLCDSAYLKGVLEKADPEAGNRARSALEHGWNCYRETIERSDFYRAFDLCN